MESHRVYLKKNQLWYMLLLGDAFGPANMLFLVLLHPIMLFLGGIKLKKMLSTGKYATLWSFPAFTAVLRSTHVCTAVCMRVCKVNSLCAYSSTTQKHT